MSAGLSGLAQAGFLLVLRVGERVPRLVCLSFELEHFARSIPADAAELVANGALGDSLHDGVDVLSPCSHNGRLDQDCLRNLRIWPRLRFVAEDVVLVDLSAADHVVVVQHRDVLESCEDEVYCLLCLAKRYLEVDWDLG